MTDNTGHVNMKLCKRKFL